MNKINVLVMTDIQPEMKAEIAAVDPEKINMVDASKVWSVRGPRLKGHISKQQNVTICQQS